MCPVVIVLLEGQFIILFRLEVRGLEHLIIIRFVVDRVVLFLWLEIACEVVLFPLCLRLRSRCFLNRSLRCRLLQGLRLEGRHWLQGLWFGDRR